MSSKYIREKGKQSKQNIFETTCHLYHYSISIWIYLNSGQNIEYHPFFPCHYCCQTHTSISIIFIFPSVCTRVQQRTQDLQMSTLCGYMQRAGTVCHIWWCPSLVEARVTYSWRLWIFLRPSRGWTANAPEKWMLCKVWRRSKGFPIGVPKGVTVQKAIFCEKTSGGWLFGILIACCKVEIPKPENWETAFEWPLLLGGVWWHPKFLNKHIIFKILQLPSSVEHRFILVLFNWISFKPV